MSNITNPAIIDLEIFEGSTGDLIFRYPAIITLTGLSCRFQVRERSGKLIINKYTASGAAISGQDITVTFAYADTSGKAGVYEYEVEAYDGTTTVNKLTRGQWTIKRQISKP